MAEYTLKGGAVVDDAYFEKSAEAAAKGDYPGTPGEWIVRPQGRPKEFDEDLVSITFKVTRSQRDYIDKCAKDANETRSQYLRRKISEPEEKNRVIA